MKYQANVLNYIGIVLQSGDETFKCIIGDICYLAFNGDPVHFIYLQNGHPEGRCHRGISWSTKQIKSKLQSGEWTIIGRYPAFRSNQ
jgi:hypothetical protein